MVYDMFFFDKAFYLSQNPDVAEAVSQGLTTAEEHFQNFGRFEERDFNPFFDVNYYLAQNPDVAEAINSGVTTTYDHFVSFGAFEQRNPSPSFDTEFYLNTNPDVRAAVANGSMTAFEHFTIFGANLNELRSPSPLINLKAYLEANPDVAAAAQDGLINPLEHLIYFGLKENRDLGNGIKLEAFALDSVYTEALESGNLFDALARVNEVAPFFPDYEPPAGWTPPADLKIPTDFIPPEGVLLIIPEGVTIPPGTILPDTFDPSTQPPDEDEGQTGGGGGGGAPVKTLTYSNINFVEGAANNGAISTNSVITLTGETFTGADGDDWSALVTNVPAGLTASLVRTSDTTATLSFTGAATDHANADDIQNLTIAFKDSHFTGGSAASVTNSTKSNLTIDFNDPGKLTYGTTTFAEDAANDGSISMTSTITLANDTFTGAVGAVLGTVTNVPVGLTAALVKATDTTATLSFTGKATAHANVNDISNLTVAFSDSAFASGNAAAVINSTKSDLTIDFSNPRLVYDTTTFVEDAANDGSITATSVITLTGETFTGADGDDWSALVTNVPAGLTASLVRTSGTTATLSFTGAATDHANADDIQNLTIAFKDSHFTGGSAANVINATKSDLAIDFNDPGPALTYGTTTFVEDAANDGSISMTSTITLANDTFVGAVGAVLGTVTNVPDGLTAALVKATDTTATLSFTGKATAHANVNDVSNLTVAFSDSAFASGNAAAVINSTKPDLAIDFADPAPTITNIAALNGVTNFDVRSPIILTFSDTISLGSGEIRIMDDMGTNGWTLKNTTTEESQQDVTDNDVVITLTDGVVTKLMIGNVDKSAEMAGSVTVDSNQLIISPAGDDDESSTDWDFDWDFGADYHIEMDAGVITANGIGNLAITDPAILAFSTVTPLGTAEGAASQKMAADGAMTAGYIWHHGHIQDATAAGFAMNFSDDAHALVLLTATGGDNRDTNIGGKILLSGLNVDDLIYMDNLGDMSLLTTDGRKGGNYTGSGNALMRTLDNADGGLQLQTVFADYADTGFAGISTVGVVSGDLKLESVTHFNANIVVFG
jgi:trimeric autotransporter adhesin